MTRQQLLRMYIAVYVLPLLASLLIFVMLLKIGGSWIPALRVAAMFWMLAGLPLIGVAHWMKHHLNSTPPDQQFIMRFFRMLFRNSLVSGLIGLVIGMIARFVTPDRQVAYYVGALAWIITITLSFFFLHTTT